MTKKQVIIGIIILLVVGVAGFLGYKLYLNKKAKNEESETNPAISKETTVSELQESVFEEPKPQILPQPKFEAVEIKAVNLDKIKFQKIHDVVAK